ncbi:hypothetical protein GDO81_029923 [Engystomops pustulosus]|uniref:Protein YIPF n=1 Tax=Engystomops pustulosus TaxID=76066 RepID=A0AAV6ZH95_ENGPU|nr:hypothetical protein GDO81_029923 [Engystomops pustulosus]KAG8546722.1 hypothetical protein GDO81_029923 [Engystomops pustulosus]
MARKFDDATNLLAANPDATTVSIDVPDETAAAQQGHRPREEEDDLIGNEDSDKTELLRGQRKVAPFWTFEYYQTFFDVDTHQVLDRIKGSVLPIPGRNFVRLYVRSNPDLYVSIAATAVYAYAWLVPLALWGFLSWRHSKVMSMVSYSFLEIVCVYGYSLFIYIPTSILWIVHSEILRWVLMSLAMCLSGAVLMLTFWPAVREDNRKIAISTLVAIMILHVLLAVGCGQYFFDQPETDHVQDAVTTIINVTKGTVQSR